jgi:hypothetical protein
MVAAVMVAAVMTAIAVELALTLRASRARVAALRGQLDDLRGALTRTTGELRAAERRLDRRETLDAASRRAQLALASPFIKTRALGAGTARAAQSFRGRRRAGAR